MDSILSAEVGARGPTRRRKNEPYESVDALTDGTRTPRGPFRPDVWLSTRRRHAVRLRVFYYRGIDVALTAIGALAWMCHPDPVTSWAELRLGHATPYVIGSLFALWFVLGSDRYSFSSPRRPLFHALTVSLVAGLGLLIGLGTAAITDGSGVMSYIQWAGLTATGLGALHLIWALAVARGRTNGALVPNVVLVGATSAAESLIVEAIRRRTVNIIGIFEDRRTRAPASICGVPVLGRVEDLREHRLTPYLDCIALTVAPDAGKRVREMEDRLSILPNKVAIILQSAAPDAREIDQALDKLAYMPVALLDRPVSDDRRAFYKRLQDLILGTSALVALMPFLFVIGVLVRLESPGPALFRQKRHGFNNETITVWKFRTMYHHQQDAGGVRQVVADDDRVTRLGRFLRSTSLDELPQLINVVIGNMSLVGPRPHAIQMQTGQMRSSDIVAEYAHRHRIKPGMTGWAAINGSRGPLHTAADVRRRIQLDIDYIERQSFWFDLWIMARTIPVLLGDRLAQR